MARHCHMTAERAFLVTGILTLSLLFLAAAGPAETDLAPGFVVIVNQANPADTLTRARVDAIFLGKIETWPDGAEMVPVHHRDEELHRLFSEFVHERSQAAIKAYWAASAFRKSMAPPARLSNHEVVEFVRASRGAIGYVREDTQLSGVKPLALTEESTAP